MSFTDNLIDDFKKDDEPTTELTNEAPKEWSRPKDETEPETQPEPAPEPAKDTEKAEPETPQELEPKQEQPKPDLSQIPQEDKIEHAFKKQLSKQKAKHEAEIADLKASFQQQFDEFKKSMQPKEEPKTRSDFATDDEYIKYLTKQGYLEAKAESDAQTAKEAAEAEEKRKAEEEQRARNEADARTFGENSRNAFKDATAYGDYTSKVNRAIENGLGEILDTVPSLRDFIFKNPEGPVVLNKMLSDQGSFIRVMGQTDPTMMIIAAHELAMESRTAEQPPVQQEEVPQPRVPHLGKPGARNASSDAGSMFGSDKSLLSFVRNVNSRRR